MSVYGKGYPGWVLRVLYVAKQLKEKSGPDYEKWRASMIAYGKRLEAERRAEGHGERE